MFKRMCKLWRHADTSRDELEMEHCETVLDLQMKLRAALEQVTRLKRKVSDYESDVELATNSTTSAFLKGFEAGRQDDLGQLARVIGRQEIVEML